MRKTGLMVLFIVAALLVSTNAHAYVWGVSPTSNNQLIEIDPFTGAINRSYNLGSLIGSSNTEIGLAGWADALYYTNANLNNGLIYTIDPNTGNVVTSYTVSGGWEIDGLGYYSQGLGLESYIYTSGCSVNDMHRYNATNGAEPQFYWSNVSNPGSVAGDNGGRIFTYGLVGQVWGIYEVDPLSSANATFFAQSPSASIVGMAFDGQYLYLSDTQNMLYTMNTSGQLVKSLQLDYTLYALGSTEGTGGGEPVIPEPSTVLLLGSGLAGVLFRRKNR